MPQIINTNVQSLNTQRSLNGSQSALATSLQRLSSGMRINSAKDDAAGLAIAERFTAQIRGLDQARRNANDGVSMSQTAEGALQSSGDILQRIRELAVQSSNATNSSGDRQALQAEVAQLTSELDRIAKTTQFNGQNLLDGTSGTLNFQVGANAGQSISASTANFRTNVYGDNRVQADAAKVAATNGVLAQKITIDGYLGSGSYTATLGDTAEEIAAGVNGQTSLTGVSATAKTEGHLELEAEAYSLKITSDNTTAVTVSFTVGGTASAADDFASAIANINAASSKTGVVAEFDNGATSGKVGIKLTNSSGNDIAIVNGATANTKLNIDSFKVDGTLVGAYDAKGAAATAAIVGTVTFNSTNGFSIDDAGTTLTLEDNMASGAKVVGASYLDSVSTLDVTNFENAQLAIQIVDSALSAVNNQRAQFGALQSRFENTVTNLLTTSENLSASRSRIRDADFAEETAKLARNQVLQQAGMAMLSQANALPQNVLSLLR